MLFLHFVCMFLLVVTRVFRALAQIFCRAHFKIKNDVDFEAEINFNHPNFRAIDK